MQDTPGLSIATTVELNSETEDEPEGSTSVVKTDNTELNNTVQDHESEDVSGNQDDDSSGIKSTPEKADTKQIEEIDGQLTTNETSTNVDDLSTIKSTTVESKTAESKTAESTTAESTTEEPFTATKVPDISPTSVPIITTPKPYKW